MRRMRHLPVELPPTQPIPHAAATVDTARCELDAALRSASGLRWAAPVGGMLAVALGVAAVAHLVTG